MGHWWIESKTCQRARCVGDMYQGKGRIADDPEELCGLASLPNVDQCSDHDLGFQVLRKGC